jgi:hypothetical protein
MEQVINIMQHQSMKRCFLIIIVVCFTSCEVYHRYFVIASNRYGPAKITVKVSASYHLPKGCISASYSAMACNADTDTEQDNNFSKQIAVITDSSSLQYSFSLPPCFTVQLQPTTFGPPEIEYLIIDDRDTISIPGSKSIYKSDYGFKKDGSQKFLLIIKAP